MHREKRGEKGGRKPPKKQEDDAFSISLKIEVLGDMIY